MGVATQEEGMGRLEGEGEHPAGEVVGEDSRDRMVIGRGGGLPSSRTKEGGFREIS